MYVQHQKFLAHISPPFTHAEFEVCACEQQMLLGMQLNVTAVVLHVFFSVALLSMPNSINNIIHKQPYTWDEFAMN